MTKFHKNSQYFAWQTAFNVVLFSLNDILNIINDILNNIINSINNISDISNDIINEPRVVFVKFPIYWNFHKLFTPKNIVEEKKFKLLYSPMCQVCG